MELLRDEDPPREDLATPKTHDALIGDFPDDWQELPAAFFDRPSDEVAPDLIGKILWMTGVGGGRLTEVEAYLPIDDPASHAFKGMTKRNSVMFGPPGHIYVYLSYGIHVLLNLVCDREAVASAVLVRSFEPLDDVSVLWANRVLRVAGEADQAEQVPPQPGPGRGPSEQDERLKWLACGPGRLGQALGLTLGLNGLALGSESGLHVFDDGVRPRVEQGTRIGIAHGKEMKLRFVAADSDYVSCRRNHGEGMGS